MERILIIDDDVQLCSMLSMYMEPHGLQVDVQHHAEAGLTEIRRRTYDLIVLDVMLPGADGFSVLRSLRTWSDIHVLLLTARGEQNDRLLGFESGADDYLAKPFNPPELIARIRAILRRGRERTTAEVRNGRISAGNIAVHLRSRTVSVGSFALELTAVEFELLAALLETPGDVLSRDNLMQRVFAREFHPEDRSLDMCVSRLRRKMDSVPGNVARIKTIRSAGYLLSLNG